MEPSAAANPVGRLGNGHTIFSAIKRTFRLFSKVGLGTTCAMLACVFEDWLISSFDRRYGIKTSGYIALNETSFDRDRLQHATGYAPVNAWALRRFFDTVALPTTSRFADLGCGLGRACIVAAEYGFSRVTGIDLAFEFCASAYVNILTYRLAEPLAPVFRIIHADVLDYCRHAEDDVFFMFRPFSREFTCKVLTCLADRAVQLGKVITVIYTEKVMMARNYVDAFLEEPRFHRVYESMILGQLFYVYRCDGTMSKSDSAVPSVLHT